jgi:hypothetical protein
LSLAAAALILLTCTTDKPPELVAQSRPGFALQNGQPSVRGLMGRTSGIAVAVPATLARLRPLGKFGLGTADITLLMHRLAAVIYFGSGEWHGLPALSAI